MGDPIWRLPDVLADLGVGKTLFYAMVKSGEFPPPIKLSARAVGWLKSEVHAWKMCRKQARDGVK